LSKPFVGNAADKKQVKEAGRKERSKRWRELEDLRFVMSSPEGRRFVWRMINEICHYDQLSFQHSGSMTSFAEGERNIGRILKGDVHEAAFEEYQQMEKEYFKDILEGENS